MNPHSKQQSCLVKFRRVGPVTVPAPKPAHPGDAGVDLYAAIDKTIWIKPGVRHLVSSGIRVEIPTGFEGQVRPRSGLALHSGLTVLNTPGCVDCSYRGIVGVILINLGETMAVIHPLDRIAQLVIAPVPVVTWEEAEQLSETERGEGGFGSTGVSSNV